MLRPPILAQRRAASSLRASTDSSLTIHHIMKPRGSMQRTLLRRMLRIQNI
jgi:hypothetical protein